MLRGAKALCRIGPLAALLHLLTAARFVVQGDSMEPELAAGHYLLVSRLAYLLAPPALGDVVVLRDPWGDGLDYVKRIVGLPGQWVELEGRKWFMEEGDYLMAGDNRRYSRDSRRLGPVARGRMVGRAWLCYWPRERWGRVG